MAWMPTVRLEADDLDTLPLDPAFGWYPQRVDVGWPDVRTVIQDAPDTDGTIDTTRYHGARPIQIPVVVVAPTGTSMWQMHRRVKPFLHPHRRVRIIGQFEEGGPDLQITAAGRKVRDGGLTMRSDDDMLLQWVAPSGLLELAGDPLTWAVDAGPGGEVPQAGLTFPATPDFTFGGVSPASGGALIDNIGDFAVWPTITMYGPFTSPLELLNETTGLSLQFLTGLSIVAGDWLRIDFAAKRIYNSAGADYYDTLDVAASDWWKLAPGQNRIYMLPTTYTAPPASFRTEWRPAWL